MDDAETEPFTNYLLTSPSTITVRHRAPITCMEPVGLMHVVTADESGQILLWNTLDSVEQRIVVKENYYAGVVSISVLKYFLLIGFRNGQVMLWDVKRYIQGESLNQKMSRKSREAKGVYDGIVQMKKEGVEISCVKFADTMNLSFAAAANLNEFNVWRFVENNDEIKTIQAVFPCNPNHIQQILFSEDNDVVVTANEHVVNVYSITDLDINHIWMGDLKQFNIKHVNNLMVQSNQIALFTNEGMLHITTKNNFNTVMVHHLLKGFYCEDFYHISSSDNMLIDNYGKVFSFAFANVDRGPLALKLTQAFIMRFRGTQYDDIRSKFLFKNMQMWCLSHVPGDNKVMLWNTEEIYLEEDDVTLRI